MSSEVPKFKVLLTGVSGTAIKIDKQEQAFVAAVSEDSPPTAAYILYTSLQFPVRLKSRLRESLKRLNIQVIKQIEISSEQLEAIYAQWDAGDSNSKPMDLDYVRYRDDVRILLARAVADGASDIHIVRRRKTATVSFRVDGRVVDHGEWTESQADRTCRFIYEVMGDEQEVTWNRHEPQDAVLDTILPDGGRVRVRIGTIPASPDGYDMVLRILPGSGETMTLNELGYEPGQVRLIRRFVRRSTGLVVMAGGVGSGKSTSIVAMLHEELDMHSGRLRIITVEDPPERVISGASQVPVVRRRGMAADDEFSFAIQGALRCDPDTLMVGEIRDLQSAVLTIKFAQSGHRVYTTVHASTALGIVGRLTGIGVESSLLCAPDILKGLIHQSLVPLLCPNCRIGANQWLQASDPGQRRNRFVERAVIALESRGFESNRLSFRGSGCEQCRQNGVTGRTVVSEIVAPDDQLLDLLRRGDFTSAKRQWLENLNGQPAIEHGVRLIAKGKVAPTDVEWRIGPLEPLASSLRSNLAYIHTGNNDATIA